MTTTTCRHTLPFTCGEEPHKKEDTTMIYSAFHRGGVRYP